MTRNIKASHSENGEAKPHSSITAPLPPVSPKEIFEISRYYYKLSAASVLVQPKFWKLQNQKNIILC